MRYLLEYWHLNKRVWNALRPYRSMVILILAYLLICLIEVMA